MSLHCGIVGLPNVGKSTIFNAMTKAKIAAENYPFCTIEPNVGVVPVNDTRLQQLAGIVEPQQVLPTTVEFVDIAGLVAGASKGEGLGNQFLGHIRETDAIAHVVRCFSDENVVHVQGKINPLDDIDVINTELLLADLATVEKALVKTRKAAKSGDKQQLNLQQLLEKVNAELDAGRPLRAMALGEDEHSMLNGLHLLTLKPTLYLANIEEQGMTQSSMLDAVKELAEKEHAQVVPLCASLEAEIAELEDEEKKEFLAELNVDRPGLDRVVNAVYDLLNLRTYFTAGEKEVRAWTIPVGANAPQAAGVIHTDFQTGFIRAEIIAYHDYIECNGEQGAKDAGKWRLEGKDYIMQDGDVAHFRFNV